MAMWTAIYAAYHLLLVLLSVGTTDFDGKPYDPEDYIVIGTLLVTVVLQLYLLPKLVKKISTKIVCLLAGSAYIYWTATAIAYGGDMGTWLIPTIYAAPLLLLYGGYCLAKAQSQKK